MNKPNFENWNSQRSAELYNVREWSAGYFDVNQDGLVNCNLSIDGNKVEVPLLDIVQGSRERGMDMPMLLRIENLLDERIGKLNQAFAHAIDKTGYQNHYRGVFPIKVNQQCHVIEEIANFGEKYHHGLEAGSKAELMIAISTLEDTQACIICNGYKDEEFITLGLHARQLGYQCFFVLETPAELPIIIKRSQEMGIRPLIGVRLKLSSKVDGYWKDDSGDRSIFGLSTSQLVDVIDDLRRADMLDCLQLLHFHLGSQIPNIRNIRTGVLEACRYYIDIVQEGAPLGYIDLGGGLAVDYEGARTNDTHSMNYSLDEYCIDIVEAIKETLDSADVAHPVIVSESGRATVAYSSVLLFNILDVNRFEPKFIPESLDPECDENLVGLEAAYKSLKPRNVQECYNDAIYYREQVRTLFARGLVNLRTLAQAEDFYLAILNRIKALLPQVKRIPQELESLSEQLADIYYGNISIFQSLPDAWAIDQIFPIMPIHRLNEAPVRDAIIADQTCDCDGKINKFAVNGNTQNTLPLHPLSGDDEYFLGAFLVGAYQETLGDLHNLFGDTNVVSVRIHADGSFDYVDEIEGDTIGDVLSYVEYYPKQIMDNFRRNAERGVRSGLINAAQRRQMMSDFNASLSGYTYYEK
ncbi:biosynthetic arginine decarboxylase [Alginatibacterium sediminis]|uniref:biosynthetic arginine decarboxylase n=1 Tax=Alginatibacterium sediminis TaxID=2164068 RepID=UPI001F1A1E03|nr:biosynthetic arginine decarboxylase [Alginatibacterium sediminis]